MINYEFTKTTGFYLHCTCFCLFGMPGMEQEDAVLELPEVVAECSGAFSSCSNCSCKIGLAALVVESGIKAFLIWHFIILLQDALATKHKFSPLFCGFDATITHFPSIIFKISLGRFALKMQEKSVIVLYISILLTHLLLHVAYCAARVLCVFLLPHKRWPLSGIP